MIRENNRVEVRDFTSELVKVFSRVIECVDIENMEWGRELGKDSLDKILRNLFLLGLGVQIKVEREANLDLRGKILSIVEGDRTECDIAGFLSYIDELSNLGLSVKKVGKGFTIKEDKLQDFIRLVTKLDLINLRAAAADGYIISNLGIINLAITLIVGEDTYMDVIDDIVVGWSGKNFIIDGGIKVA